MHDKLVLGGHIERPPVTVPAPDESPATERSRAWKRRVPASGSSGPTASAVQPTIESAVLYRYPGIATRHKNSHPRISLDVTTLNEALCGSRPRRCTPAPPGLGRRPGDG